ncbi:hypothetical protein SAMN05421753_10840 [Planctomicrobium piriforme]|uniref:Uncharacterized protein n=1 Tax=Planctomicrobium piriforme TaxID=1576369 RepID=A0A1I3HFS3_9PLAN|nr:hypothetical protein SAMN05421753_10840 [Planctomicrobium piriforme]
MTEPHFQFLPKHAKHLDGIRFAAQQPKISYEWLSGALVWSDEIMPATPNKAIVALRPVWAYRTSLILNEPRPSLLPYWERALQLFPNWVGFRPERRLPSPKLLQIYHRGNDDMNRTLDTLLDEE